VAASPLAFDLRPEEEITPAVEQFHQTAANAYSGDPAAIEEGKEIHAKLCQACHLADGSGRIGPSLADDEGARARTGTDLGRFEIIYAGGAGAMQAFGQRLDQDQILQVMAYLEVLREEAQ
jgi:cytochrome c-L